jgi:hypothetical protein
MRVTISSVSESPTQRRAITGERQTVPMYRREKRWGLALLTVRSIKAHIQAGAGQQTNKQIKGGNRRLQTSGPQNLLRRKGLGRGERVRREMWTTKPRTKQKVTRHRKARSGTHSYMPCRKGGIRRSSIPVAIPSTELTTNQLASYDHLTLIVAPFSRRGAHARRVFLSVCRPSLHINFGESKLRTVEGFRRPQGFVASGFSCALVPNAWEQSGDLM